MKSMESVICGLESAIEHGHYVEFTYKNYRGETAGRIVKPIRVFFGENEFHGVDKWLFEGYDISRNDKRVFSVEEIIGSVSEISTEYYKSA